MADPFIGEIRCFAFDFVPQGWALCNGQLLSIQQNTALYSILGTTYGGNGTDTFALPDLRGRAPVHVGNNIVYGKYGGEETHALTLSEMPAHTRIASASTDDANVKEVKDNVWAMNALNIYGTDTNVTMSSQAISTTGGEQAHNNMQPYQTANYCIAVVGLYPSRD